MGSTRKAAVQDFTIRDQPNRKAALQAPSALTMQDPTGASGVQVFPNKGQSPGPLMPHRISPQMHPFGS